MFGKLFGFKQKKETSLQADSETTALINAVRERSKEDVLIGAKISGKEVFKRVLKAMENPRGVHLESLLTAMGALAGYACQAGTRAQALADDIPENEVFQSVETVDGKRYFFGVAMNAMLFESQHSLWSMTGGAAQLAGATVFPDLNDIFKHTSSVLGSDEFGRPRVPENHKPGDTPLNFLKPLWPMLFPAVELYCPDPAHWSIAFSFAIQEAIYFGKDVIDPNLAFQIVMESAIPMSKIDLGN